ncbi:MAG: hypothetical protein RL701_4134 [Pseudomonadota bacterium]
MLEHAGQKRRCKVHSGYGSRVCSQLGDGVSRVVMSSQGFCDGSDQWLARVHGRTYDRTRRARARWKRTADAGAGHHSHAASRCDRSCDVRLPARACCLRAGHRCSGHWCSGRWQCRRRGSRQVHCGIHVAARHSRCIVDRRAGIDCQRSDWLRRRRPAGRGVEPTTHDHKSTPNQRSTYHYSYTNKRRQ